MSLFFDTFKGHFLIDVLFLETSIDPTDPRWIGALWLWFYVFGALSIAAAIPMIFYPKCLVAIEQEEVDIVNGKPNYNILKGTFVERCLI